MRSRLVHFWEDLRSSYWFLPSLMALGAFLLSQVTIRLDENLPTETLRALRVIRLSQPDGARALLSTVAGSMITVAGVTFSIVMVVLSLASSQFGPRLLRNFMRDTGNQVVLGTFLATFLYCLMVLRTVRAESADGAAALFVPQLSLTVAVLLTILNLGVFIYFIHHTAETMQVETLLDRVSGMLRHRIVAVSEEPRMFADRLGEGAEPPARVPEPIDAAPVFARRTGYVQAVHQEDLLALAREHDVVVRLRLRPGDFVMERQPIADVSPGRYAERVAERLDAQFELGPHRSPEQDVPFLFDQLLEVGLRAISPGVNDPLTALHCLDHIVANLRRLDSRDLPAPERRDEDDAVRVIVPTLDRDVLARRLFGAFRAYGAGDPLVARRLLAHLHTLHAAARDPALARACAEEADRLVAAAEREMLPQDAQDLAEERRRKFGG